MEEKVTKDLLITDMQTGNLEFLEFLPGAYCYKNNSNGSKSKYAYIYSDYRRLIIFNNPDLQEYDIYDWDSPNTSTREHNHKTICDFLSELCFRILLKKGTKVERKIADSYWQLYSSQSSVPEELKSRVEAILKQII